MFVLGMSWRWMGGGWGGEEASDGIAALRQAREESELALLVPAEAEDCAKDFEAAE